MQRLGFYFDQAVQDDDLILLQDQIEGADQNIAKDWLGAGILSGLEVTPNNPADLTAQILTGIGYDDYGRRVYVPATQIVNLASQVPATAGNERWATVVARFARNNWDQRQDGAGQQIYYRQDESFTIAVLAGAEAAAGAAVKPAAAVGDIILADVKLTQGQTQIQAANIDTNRRQLIRPLWSLASEIETARGGFITLDARLDVMDARSSQGESTFASTTGRTITHNLGHTNYTVNYAVLQDTLGDLGDVWISKAANAFTIYNTGGFTGSFWYLVRTT